MRLIYFIMLLIFFFMAGAEERKNLTREEFVMYLSDLEKEDLLKATDYLEYLIEEGKEVLFPLTFDEPEYVPGYRTKCQSLRKRLVFIMTNLFSDE